MYLLGETVAYWMHDKHAIDLNNICHILRELIRIVLDKSIK